MALPTLIEITLFNAATATVLALVAAVVGRWTRRPGIAHALWALVLLKLVFPPVIEMSVVPNVTRQATVATMDETPARVETIVASAPVALPSSSLGVATATRRISWQQAALAIWSAGSLYLLMLTFVRVRRFRRLVTASRHASPAFAREAHAIASRMGVRCPTLKIVAARVSPMLWFPGSSPALLFPAELLATLTAGERDTLLAHELAHVQRRDHLLRFVELFATIAFWWHPVVWWARRSLRRLEEQSCDAVVLHALPGQGESYARGLVKTVEFLAGHPARVPALASGATTNGDARNLEERLNMILSETTPCLLSRTQRTFLALVAVGALLVVPSWAEPRPEGAADDPAVDEDFERRLRDIEDQALDIELEMQQLDTQRSEMEFRRAELMAERELAVLRQKAETARRQGLLETADRLREEADAMERLTALKLEKFRLEVDHSRRARELELEWRRQRVASDLASSDGDLASAEAIRRELLQTELEMRQMKMERSDVEHRLKQDRSVEAELMIELERRKLEELERRDRNEAESAKLKAALAEVLSLEEAGELDKADALRDKIRYLQQRIEAEQRDNRVY